MQDELSDMDTDALDQIAVVGMACRFPKAADVDEFWKNLRDGVEGIHFFSDEELLAAGIGPETFGQPEYVRAKGVLADADMLDAELFGLTPREAELMDPQQRLFLECCHRAFEHAGYDPGAFPGKVGVYGGSGFSSYLVMNLMSNLDFLMSAGPLQARIFNDKDFLTTHVSYRLNLRGPSMAVQTACSTSLVAVHLASQALLEGECDMALAGGCTINFPQTGGYGFVEGSIFSPDGHCRSFDAKAAGTVEGNGGGAVLLKRLGDALADGDTVYAVIRGSAVNNDGSQKAGFTAPSVESQTRVVLEAFAIAGVEPESISHVEAHGSATPLGDPIEVESLTRAFRQSTDRKGFCGLGSVKSNIGHTDTGAGIASLIKTVQALRHGQLPPSLHFESPNPRLNLPESPFYVNAKLKDWPETDGPRRASINSLGIGGTNAHVVLEEAPALPATTPSRPWQLVALSARTGTALDAATERLAGHLASDAGDDFADVAHTLRVGRKPMKHRRVLVARDRGEAAEVLAAGSGARVVTGVAGDGSGAEERPVTFLFPGLGEHYLGMGAELYEREPAFRRAIDKAAQVLEPILGADLRKVIYPEGFTAPTGAPGEKKQDMRRLLAPEAEPESEAERTLNRTAFAHPAIFAVEYALAEQWKEWGIAPQAMIGYSLGEYVAACLAGVFSYEDGLRLVARRAQLIDALPEGAMLAVPLPADEVRPLLAEYGLSLSAANGPALSVVGGEPEAVERFAAAMGERNVACRKLKSSHAFHSHLMEPIVGEMRQLLAGMKLAAPATPVISNVTGTWLTEKEACDPDYWAQHLRKTVLFSQGLSTLISGEPRLLLEVGPGQTLATLARQHPERSAAQVAVASLRDRRDEVSDQAFLLEALGRLWVAGAKPDWAGFTGAEKRRRVPLPTYPYERRRYFIEPGTMGLGAPPPAEDTSRLELSRWFSAPVWERLPDEPAAAAGDLGGLRILVFADEGGVGERLASRLAERGANAVTVRAGGAFAETGEGVFTVAPGNAVDYKSLLKALKPRGFAPDRIVHLWNLGSDARGISPAALAVGGERGFYSLLFLAQALAEVEADRHEPMNLIAVADGLFEVTGGEALAPAKATLLGPCRVLPQELPLLSALALDVVLPADDAGRDALAARLAGELEALAGKHEPVLAWRGPYAWVRRFRSVELPEAELPEALREGGAYLVTGGLSDTGVTLAEHLWQKARARLALFMDGGVPQRERWADHLSAADEDDAMAKRMRRVLALEAAGCEVFALPVDFERQDEIESAVRRSLTRFGALHGVFHAAGAAGAGMALFKSRELAQMILAPKVLGTAVLAEQLASQALDFFALFGSNVAVTGGFGQVDTTAGAAFLDAVAAWDRAAGRRRFAAIDWGFFRWQPIQAPDPAIVEQLKAGLEAYGIGAPEMLTALARALRSGRAEVIVSTQPLERVLAQFDSGGMLGALSGTSVPGGPAKPAESHPRPELDVPYVAPRNETEEKIARVWSKSFGIEPIGMDDNFFDLAGNSLLAIQIVTQIATEMGAEISMASLLEAPTVAGLAAKVDEAMGAAAAPALTDDEEMERLLAEIEALSAEEAEAQLTAGDTAEAGAASPQGV